jgi:flagellar biosynthesis activator protein FlaF
MSPAGRGPVTGANGTMQGFGEATRAYAASASRRSVREQEAEVFRRVNAALRRGRDRGGQARARALADTVRLWNAVIDLLGDPDNALPPDLRASIISVGLAARRDAQSDDPDFDFLITVHENIAAGLSDKS